ncbi:aryl-alcohol dehydrogenase-like predicted oxidoreductase [Kribbella aluminosa]|uniref:Aryl-alcohol dehydrogenase-like predicted oxidoreductase n=1 Tax=Kribbella aluminosa TaxID=416017 RepID=A0ABS4UJ98_9ACTN|nr:aldo/keto reductase [Kribbella aluminosa]MBP2351689.1 aryl-alcohol dehydrogenase-like predicted oxidoreductase [Kribbella aluminosa]
MSHRQLGASGLVLSEIGVGASTFGRTGMRATGQDTVTAIVDRALDLGVTYFDLAEGYGDRPGQSEELFAAAIGKRREKVVIGTKFGRNLAVEHGPSYSRPGARKYIVAAVEESLRRLRTDYIDLYQIHFPDPLTPIEETLSALDTLVRSGKVRYVGASNFKAWQLADADHVARDNGLSRFVSTTDEYNLLWRKPEEELIPALRHYGLGFIPYFPLQNGLLTGKYSADHAPVEAKITNLKRYLLRSAPWEALAKFEQFARDRNVTPSTAALGWLLAQPTVTSVIAGVTVPEQLDENVLATRWAPTADEEAELRGLFTGDLSGGPGVVDRG